MRKNVKKLRRYTNLMGVGAVFVLAGCAAQDAFKLQRNAEAKYFEAERLAPQSKLTQEAGSLLVEGQQAARDSRFDVALKKFKDSQALSAASISEALAPPPPPPPEPVATPTVIDEPVRPRRTLPKDVLARYLAEKSRAKSEEPAKKKIEKPAAKAPKVLQSTVKKVERTPLPTVEEKAAPAGETVTARAASSPTASAASSDVPKPTSSALPTPVAKDSTGSPPTPDEISDEAPASGADLGIDGAAGKAKVVENAAKPATTILAPSAPIMKKAPAPARPATKEQNLRKVPGSVTFQTNDASLDGTGMGNLDLMAKYLLENPSTTFVLSPVVGPGEGPNLPEARYETSRAYLLGKGVPEDQIQLDTVRRSGPRGEFEFFVIEH